jgi:SAM-dependent methyltransferase
VLDYGCGDALDAPRVAARVGRLLLYDGAREVRQRVTQRVANEPRIAVPDDAALDALAPGVADLIVVNSVIQYLSRAELDGLLARAKRWLKPAGRLVLADIVPPGDMLVPDTLALLRTAARHGFLGAALLGLVATFFSDYWKLRRTLGLSCYGETEMRAILAAAGFVAERRPENFGFNLARMTFVARPRP